MKKLVLISTFIASILAGCGGSSNDESLAPQSSNVLTIQGDKLNQKTTVDQIADNVRISATGNQSIDSVSWNSGGGKNERFKTGQIFLDNGKESAKLWFLADAIDVNGIAKGFLLNGFACGGVACRIQPTYLLTKVKDELNLQIKFDNNQYLYQDASTIGKDVTPKSKTIIAQKKDGIIINPTLPTQPDVSTKLVKVTGDLNFKIPSNWPIALKDRFSTVPIQGQFKFDGQTYKVSSIKLSHIIGENGTAISATLEINLKSDTDKIFLSLTENKDSSHPFGSSIMMIKGDDYYHAEILETQNFWSESIKEIKLNMSNIGLFNDKTSTTKLLSSNLIIPQADAAINLNGQALILNKNSSIVADAINDQKLYSLDFGSSSASTSTLKIIHELKGHISAKYQIDDQSYTCGSREIACTGLSVDSDQKTYHFNQVKVGSNTLNGSVFIPGVFE